MFQQRPNHGLLVGKFSSATFFKKSTLSLVKAKVTFTVSSFKTRCSGGDRKSATNLTSPIGSSVGCIPAFFYTCFRDIALI
ncbi:MAG: hypothetical protein H0U70_06450 [Tatlockia sp.]|nr:hypothetical protein [Tatlockia sp.]